MEIRSLKYFVAVARQLSFSHAAESLFVTQSSLSKTISALEKELGVELFIRKGRSIALTPAGEELLSGAEALLAEEASLSERVSLIKEKRQSSRQLIFQLRQPVPSNFDFCKILVETALEFKKRYVPLHLEFRYDTEPYPLADIPGSRNTADLFFSMATEVKMDPNLHILALSKDPFYLLASDQLIEEALSAFSKNCEENFQEDLLSEECRLFCINYLLQRRPLLIMEDEGNAVLDISEVLQALNIPPNIRFVKGQMNLLSELATESGLALMPGASSTRMAIPGISSLKLPEQLPQVSLFALYRRDSENALLPLFIEELEKKLGKG
jgi:DNA-binding transcriptional LysR family regulator